MTRVAVVTDSAPKPAGAYSQAVVANGFLYTAGFGPQDPRTGQVAGPSIEEQTAQVMRNIAAVLAEHSLDFSHVVKATVHLQDLHRDFAGFNTVYQSFLQEPYPVRTTVGSDLANILVEIDVVAAVPAER
ncbi:2-iminobutanoate/2-iminopropanoate deaminase [Micromonospora viridifaciens]|uniref:2-iminobutanoate/2-iminopropanoate deaminase n=1 Tax=Micromonospora viridifaciens TaxID=1881 RepID=A0A1C4WT04_MICVI|nr:Rid family detoxifying hydrolase [Micromonospora viridifaciens]SCE99299.1 2-iminobutanoate/2-iminopropanoate deaminase [Micromonospora viridifaciens]